MSRRRATDRAPRRHVARSRPTAPGAPAATAIELSPREGQALRLIAEGDPSRRIGAVLDIKVHTVDNHIQRLLKRLGARSRANAVAVAIRRKLIE